MKLKYNNTLQSLFLLCLSALTLTSCNKYLDRAPLSNVTPNDYLNTEVDLATFTLGRYNFPSHGGWGVGTFANDNHTDNQVNSSYATRWVPGEWRVSSSGGDWDFANIFNINYFIQNTVPKWKNNTISGNPSNIDHYIGEAYFLRAYEYFNKL